MPTLTELLEDPDISIQQEVMNTIDFLCEYSRIDNSEDGESNPMVQWVSPLLQKLLLLLQPGNRGDKMYLRTKIPTRSLS
jgi:hypothetical protein